MAADEQSTVRRITAYRREISNLVSDHRGRIVDATGDNALAEFGLRCNNLGEQAREARIRRT